jgi:hypothetical protein
MTSGTRFTWHDGKITAAIDDQKFNEDTGSMDTATGGAITATPEEWLDIVVGALMMLPGKPNETGNAFALCPVGTDPAMIGTLIATKILEHPLA